MLDLLCWTPAVPAGWLIALSDGRQPRNRYDLAVLIEGRGPAQPTHWGACHGPSMAVRPARPSTLLSRACDKAAFSQRWDSGATTGSHPKLRSSTWVRKDIPSACAVANGVLSSHFSGVFASCVPVPLLLNALKICLKSAFCSVSSLAVARVPAAVRSRMKGVTALMLDLLFVRIGVQVLPPQAEALPNSPASPSAWASTR
jgi:hypothetical protein